MRPDVDKYMMEVADIVALRSTCTSHHSTGAVATIDGRIIMTAYNGVPSGMPHCDAEGCVRLSDGKHAFLLHAEENLVAQAAKYHAALNGSTVYVTHFPCPHCAAILVQAGVVAVIVGKSGLETEIEHNYAIDVFHAARVTCIPLALAPIWRGMQTEDRDEHKD